MQYLEVKIQTNFFIGIKCQKEVIMTALAMCFDVNKYVCVSVSANTNPVILAINFHWQDS